MFLACLAFIFAITTTNKFISNSTSFCVWHTRLGHHNSHVMNLVLKECNISLHNKADSNLYKSSCAGKSHRLPSHDSVSIYSPLELKFANLWGSVDITSDAGYKYYVSFVDAYSQYTWIFPIKTKNEKLSVFQTYKTMVELQLTSKIVKV